MVLVAKKIKENFSFLIFWASLVGEEKWRTRSSCSSKKKGKKINLTNFFSYF